MDKSKLKDSGGRYLVQGLFLEDRYDKDMAVFTFDGEDKEYKGKTFISLKKRYLEEGDPTEYNFATKWLYDWPHWERLCKNAVVGRHIEKWREELELSLRADAISAIVDAALQDNHYQSAKYLADKGWDVKKRGRPSKAEVEGALKKEAEEKSGYDQDFKLLKLHKGDK